MHELDPIGPFQVMNLMPTYSGVDRCLAVVRVIAMNAPNKNHDL